jgi:hypothetical protein
MNADFVIISYQCNFWGLAAVDALVDALEVAGIDRQIYVVHNAKTTEQIDHFKACCRSPVRSDAITHIVAYEGVFEQVVNYADFARDGVHHFLAGHSLVLNWLIKYRLAEGAYFFVDHDCIARPGFVRFLADQFCEIEGKLFVFPLHESEPRSLTAPLFYCDTDVRRHLGGLCDIGWSKNIVCGERDKLRDGGEVFYTKSEIERAICRQNFDDTLHNVVRYLLARSPGLVERLAVMPWRECDHVWHGATRRLFRLQVDLLKDLFATRFQPEYFSHDKDTELYASFLDRLGECGLGSDFAARFLNGAPKAETGVSYSQAEGAEI